MQCDSTIVLFRWQLAHHIGDYGFNSPAEAKDINTSAITEHHNTLISRDSIMGAVVKAYDQIMFM